MLLHSIFALDVKCQSKKNLIVPGVYKLQVGLRKTLSYCNDAFNFEISGMYVVNIDSKKEYTDVIVNNLIGPLEISIVWLLFPIIMMAAGRTLIEVTGLDVIYTRSHPKLKIIAIGCWIFFSKSGDLINTAYNGSKNFDILIELKNVPILLLCSVLIFICIAMYAFYRFNANWELSAQLQLDVVAENQDTHETEEDE